MTPLTEIIREEMAEQGAIQFARFMELALYCPDCGFYEKEGDNVGRGGDFYTSVSAGPLFGELLAFQFDRWFNESGAAALRIVEAGAHDGRLASDILHWCRRQRPELFERVEYVIFEPSARRRDWQNKTLIAFPNQVHWLKDWPEFAARNTSPEAPFTICFANELLDALPVRRFGWDATKGTWFEWGVAAEADRFVWTRLAAVVPHPTLHLPSAPELLAVLPDGYSLEISPAAEQWWGSVARALKRGKLLTFDYGFDLASMISPDRPNGTLRAYREHKQTDDVLANPGEQDITAHVNFARIEQAGLAAGLTTDKFESQGRFLTQLAAEAWKTGARFGEWNAKRTRQFQTLTHPQHLGQSFRVLVQSRS